MPAQPNLSYIRRRDLFRKLTHLCLFAYSILGSLPFFSPSLPRKVLVINSNFTSAELQRLTLYPVFPPTTLSLVRYSRVHCPPCLRCPHLVRPQPLQLGSVPRPPWLKQSSPSSAPGSPHCTVVLQTPLPCPLGPVLSSFFLSSSDDSCSSLPRNSPSPPSSFPVPRPSVTICSKSLTP